MSVTSLYDLLKLNESYSSDEEYDSSDLLSFSKVKNALAIPSSLFDDREREDSEWLDFGSIVDIMLTAPDKINDKILVLDNNFSDMYLKIINHISNNIYDFDIDSMSDEQLDSLFAASGVKVNWTAATKKKNLKDSGVINYVSKLRDNPGKIVVVPDVYLKALKTAECVRNHRFTSLLFREQPYLRANGIDVLFQYKIRYSLYGLEWKSKIDCIIINHRTKSINLIDFKTGSDYWFSFPNHNFMRYKYYLQAELYTRGFLEFIAQPNIMQHMNDYRVSNFVFVYISRLEPQMPVPFTLSTHTILYSTYKETPTLSGKYLEYVLRPNVSTLSEAIKRYRSSLEDNVSPSSIEPYIFKFIDGFTVSDDGVIGIPISF